MNNNKMFWNATMTWGALTALCLVVFQLIMYFTNPVFFTNPQEITFFISIIPTILLIIGLTYGMKYFRDNHNNGFLKYGRGVGFAVIMGLFIGFILGFFDYLLLYQIDKSLLDLRLSNIQYALEEMFPNFTDEQIEQNMMMQKVMMKPMGLIFSGILNYAFYSTLFSLIIAAFLKRKDTSWNSNFEQ